MRKQISFLFLFLSSAIIFAETYDWEVLNRNGEIEHIIPGAKEVSGFSNELIIVSYGTEFAILNTNFAEVLRKQVHLAQFSVMQNNRIGYFEKSVRKYGYLDTTGNIAIKPLFDHVENFVHGFAVVGLGDTDGPPPYRFDYKIIDTSGNYVSPTIFSSVELSHHVPGKGVAKIRGSRDSYIIEFDGSAWKVVDHGENISRLSPAGTSIIYSENDKYGFMSWDGELLTEPLFSAVWSYSNDRFIVWNEKKERILVDRNGTRIPFPFRNAWHIFDNRYVSFFENGKAGVYDLEMNKVVLLPEYDDILGYSEGVFNVSLNDRYGYVDMDGSTLGEIKYDRTLVFNNGIAVAGIKRIH